MDMMQNYRDQLARRLEQRSPRAADPGLRDLAWALVGYPPPDPATCDQVQDALPEYVEAEIGGSLNTSAALSAGTFASLRAGLTGSELAALHRHLLLCAECGRLHARLLQIAWLLARDELPHPIHRPAPRLPFGGRSA